jgi:hypothetical protein
MPPAFTSSNPNDISIANLVGLETYKALYTMWPNLYSYISDPLTPTSYFNTLVSGIVATSGLEYQTAGSTIRTTLLSISNGEDVSNENYVLVQPLIASSYEIKYLNDTFWENVIWISVTVFLAFFIIWYLYVVGFWAMIFNLKDGIVCYDCPSIFDWFTVWY